MEEILIFVICLYLIITNPFIRLSFNGEGIFLILKLKSYLPHYNEWKEEVTFKVTRLIKFNNNKKPF
mgnify:CR=1 FL=1